MKDRKREKYGKYCKAKCFWYTHFALHFKFPLFLTSINVFYRENHIFEVTNIGKAGRPRLCPIIENMTKWGTVLKSFLGLCKPSRQALTCVVILAPFLGSRELPKPTCHTPLHSAYITLQCSRFPEAQKSNCIV